MSNRARRNKSKVIILALILLLPGFLYIAVNRLGSNEYVSLPVFGEKRLSGEMKRNWGREYPDTIFHTVSAIDFKTLDGKLFSFPAPDTCVSIVHLFYSRDASFSTAMFQAVDLVATRFMGNPRINFFSLSVDPKENREAIAKLLKPYKGIDQKHWKVGLQPSKGIFDYAKEQLLIDAMVDPADSTRFLISNQMVLLDSKRHIRGFYDSSQKTEVDRLQDEIKLLMVEEIRNRAPKLEKK